MKHTKRDILLHLYGESESESDLRSLLRDKDLKAEYTAMSETKFKLDLKKSDRPDRHVIDAIMEAARAPHAVSSTIGGKRRGRGPVSRTSRLKRVMLPALGIAAALVFAVGVYWNSTTLTSPSASVASSAMEDTVVPPESLYRFVPSRQGGLTNVQDSKTALSWDDGNTLPNLRDRINTLKPADRLDWGEAAMPLEMLPGTNRPGFQTAGSNR
jgi:hypothetical protein